MVIGTKTVKRRSPPSVREPDIYASVGDSMAGDTSVKSHGLIVYPVTLRFTSMDQFTVGSICGVDDLELYLTQTIGKGGSVLVVPDYMNEPTNTIVDTLDCRSTISGVNLIFLSFKASWSFGYKYNVEIEFERKVVI